jgi:excisionase family DNA binding protein
MPKEEFMTAKEAGALLRVCGATIYRWSQSGLLRPLRIGRTLRFKRSDLLTMLEKFADGSFEQKRPDRPDRPEWS